LRDFGEKGGAAQQKRTGGGAGNVISQAQRPRLFPVGKGIKRKRDWPMKKLEGKTKALKTKEQGVGGLVGDCQNAPLDRKGTGESG